MVPPVKKQPGQSSCGATENAAALKEPKKAKVFSFLDQGCSSMLESQQCGITAALGLTCKAFFPGCSPEAVPGPAGGAPGVVAEASPEVGPPSCCHPHPHHIPTLAQSHRSGPNQIHSLSSCLLSWTGKAFGQEKPAGKS